MRRHWGNSVMYSDWRAGVMHKYAVAFFNYLYASKKIWKPDLKQTRHNSYHKR